MRRLHAPVLGRRHRGVRGQRMPSALTDETFVLDGQTIPNPLRSFVLPVWIVDQVQGDPVVYSKPQGYETVRYPLSGLVGTPQDQAATQAHNANYPNYAQTVGILDKNVTNWLNGQVVIDGNPWGAGGRGFRPGTRTGSGTWQVRGRDVLAWPEVRFAGVGWVPFHPTPGEAAQGGSGAVAVEGPGKRQSADRESTAPTRPSTSPRPPDGATRAAGGTSGSGMPPLWLTVPLVLLLLATAYVLYALWLPYDRRGRRRNDPDVRRRVLGAWQQIGERLTEIGLPATGAHTAQEIAAFGAEHVGGAVGRRLSALATLVNEVEYADRRPDTAAADAAWADCEEVEKTVRHRVPRHTRLLRLLRSAAPGRRRRRGRRSSEL